VVSARAGDVEEVHHRPALRVRDERIPLVELGAILGSTPAATDPLHAIVLGQDGRRVALAVSGWEDDQDVVVKPLGELLEGARLFAGACLLESGELTLVLNPATLMAQALDEDRDLAWRARPKSGAAAPRRQRILFAEDSPVTRSMIFGVLTELGYQVQSAQDGKEALDLLLERGADLVLTDFDMPAMNGLALVRQIRGHDAWKTLPIIVLSTRDSEADRQRALEAGADEYLFKGGRWEAQLRKILRRKLDPPS
jgi:two-component system, chemotaxis family, sensor kinase CheA